MTKTLADGTKVNDSAYYFLLDWNDRDNFLYLTHTLGKNKLCELNLIEYNNYFHMLLL